MNESDSNFQQLRKLLAVKRHETPPPGYFNNFSDDVVRRIRLGESKSTDGALGTLFSEAPWVLRFLQIFEAKPAYAGVFASVLFLLVVAGIVYSDHPQAEPDSLMPAESAQADQPAASGTALASMSTSLLTQTLPQVDLGASTNSALSLQPVSAGFGAPSGLFQQAIFTH